MSLENLQRDKQQLEKKMSELIGEFQDKYKVVVNDINFDSNIYRTTTCIRQSDIKVYIEVTL